MDFIVNIISAPAEWLRLILSRSGTAVIWVGAIVMILFFRYLIFPLVGTDTGTFNDIRQPKENMKRIRKDIVNHYRAKNSSYKVSAQTKRAYTKYKIQSIESRK